MALVQSLWCSGEDARSMWCSWAAGWNVTVWLGFTGLNPPHGIIHFHPLCANCPSPGPGNSWQDVKEDTVDESEHDTGDRLNR